MTRAAVTRAMVAGALFAVAVPEVSFGQTAPAAPAPTTAPAAKPAAPLTQASTAQAPSVLALETPGFTYDPAGRRDPFISLRRRGSDAAAVNNSSRPAGLIGLGVGETTLRGTLASRGGFVAILQGSDEKTYIVHPGEKLLDGSIRAITADAVVFLQHVNDPLSLEKQREVRKVLRQTEEAK